MIGNLFFANVGRCGQGAGGFDGKAERAFRTFRLWWRLVLPTLQQHGLQRRIDHYGKWYNEQRPHSALGGRTPEEAWRGVRLPAAVVLRERDRNGNELEVQRGRWRSDSRLPVIRILRRAA